MKRIIALLLTLCSLNVLATPIKSTQLKTAEYADWVNNEMEKADVAMRKTQVIYDWYKRHNDGLLQKLYDLSFEAIQRDPAFPLRSDNFSVLISSNQKHAVFVGGASSLPYSGPNVGLRVYDMDTDSLRQQVRHSLKFVGVLEDSEDNFSLLLAEKDAHIGLERLHVPVWVDGGDDVASYRYFYTTKKSHQLYEYNVTNGTIEKIGSNFDESISFEDNSEYFDIPLCVNISSLSNGAARCLGKDARWFERQLKTFY